jgi:beta-phosphoglucomutase
MVYKAVIFDMDGTIVDTEKVWGEATRRIVEKKRGQCAPEFFALLRSKTQGLDMRNACMVIKELTGIDDCIHALCREKEDLAHTLYRDGIVYNPGFFEFHDQLHTRGIKTAIATNAHNSTIGITQEALNIQQFFGEHIYGIECTGRGKPHPDIYIYAAQKIAVDPVVCVAIEDSAHGIKAAKQAGMFCIGINTSKNYEQLKEADYIIEGFKDIDLDMLFGGLGNDA